MAQESTQAIFPIVSYRDARAAIEWLGRAFGFEVAEIHPAEGDGPVEHCELRFQGNRLMLGSEGVGNVAKAVSAGRAWNYIAIDDADALYARAKEAGAEVVMEPEDQDYGSRDFTVKDPEGNVWSFGTYRPTPPAGDLVYFVVPARDAERSKRFYSELLGWEFSPGNIPGGFNIEGPTPPGGLFGGGDGSAPSVYFGVDDIDAAVAKVRELGGEAEEPQDITSGRMSACRDDQGVELNLWTPKRG